MATVRRITPNWTTTGSVWARVETLRAQQCGWLKDKFGVSWQVVLTGMGELMSDPDPAVAERVMAAFLPMKKLVIVDLENAARG